MRAFLPHRANRRYSFTSILLLLLCWLLSSSPANPPRALAQSYEGRYYQETGHTLASQFVNFYDTHGGLALFGYPVTDAEVEGGYLVQWTERQRFEYHPENAGTDYEVQLGLLGRELTSGYTGPHFQAQSAAIAISQSSLFATSDEAASTYYFQQTGEAVSGLFLQYWTAHGGLSVFGYPISDVFTGNNGLQVQWFERARFEYHPENDAENNVLLGHLGIEAKQMQAEPVYAFNVYDDPVPAGNLQIGFAQGGESSNPGFFSNIDSQGSAQGPGLVRQDNIFNFYHIVQRGADGTVTYHWAELDQVLDDLKAMGKEPMLCLSYMPETLSVGGNSRVLPPANYDEWAALITATVTHVNIDRKMGVRYWEVWNEPNQWDFWQSSFEEYLHLYDVTVAAALKVDPTIRIGGPAISSFEQDSFGEFLQHETNMGDQGHVDFLSWHSYGQSPEPLAADIRQVRSIVAQFPRFKPELMITEFNVLQGGPGDTSAGHATDKAEGAIAFLSSIESMQRERLDRALLFELKDGAGAQEYWGRWGILTYGGQPKPVYYAYQAYQNRPGSQLPVSLTQGTADGTIGMLAYGSESRSTLFLWYTGQVTSHVKLSLPSNFAGVNYDVALFDDTTNNPAAGINSTLATTGPVNVGDLAFDLKPESLLIITSR